MFTINENEQPTLNVLSNDTTFPDIGETLSITAVTVLSCTDGIDSSQSTSYAVASPISSNSAIQFSPAQYFWGTCTLSYTISDGNGGTSTAQVAITVSNGNTLLLVSNTNISIYSQPKSYCKGRLLCHP